jgi:O-antigen/teichoic acid export membrane protein
MGPYSREGARRALFHTVGFRALSQLATVIGTVVLVRAMSVASLGIYSLLYSVIPVIGAVASLGLDQALKRYQPEYLRAGNTQGSAWLVRYVSIARLLSSVAVIVLLLCAWNVFAPLFKMEAYRADFALLSVVLVLYFQVIIFQSALASHMLHRYSVGSAAALSVGKLLSYLLMITLGGLTLRRAILADTAAYVAAFAFLYIVYWRLCRPQGGSLRYRPGTDERRRMQRFALISNFSDASSLLLYVQTDNLFIAALMNPIAVGAYAFYARLNEMTLNLIPIRLFENVVQPLLFSVRPEDAAERLPRYFTLLVNVSLLVQFPLVAFTAAYHHEIILLLFGGKFIEYSSLLPLIVAFAFSDNVISTPVTMVAQYSEQAGIILKSQLFGLYQIVAMLALIPMFGLYGAATATGTLHLFRNAYVWWRVRRYARWINWAPALVASVTLWGGAIAACYAFKSVTSLSPLMSLMCGAVICAIVGLVCVRSPALADSDREILGRVLHGRERKILRWLGLVRVEVAPHAGV